MSINKLLVLLCLVSVLLGQPFLYNQSLSLLGLASETCDISGDNQILVLGNSIFHETVIYRNNGTIFIPMASLAVHNSEVEIVDITDDGRWVLVVELVGEIYFINIHR